MAGAPDDVSQLRHDLRTPIHQIIGYSELLEEEAAQAGLDSFVADLQKIQRSARVLLAAIERVLAGGRPTPPRTPADPGASSDGPAPSATPVGARLSGRVLVVDDDEVNRDVLKRWLERLGCTVQTAGNGEQALALAKPEAVDLVLLDVMMPGMDGEEVLRRLKGSAATREIAVVMLSAADDTSRVARSLDVGAEDFLPKPFEPVLLRARVGSCLERKALRDREREAHLAFVASQKELAIQLADAADYVESLLPERLTGAVSIDWRFIPSTSLGGDVFGYHWIDDDHLAIYLLDVCGHGVSTALLSVSAVNVLRSHALPGVDFRAPAQVLAGLNTAFPMDKQNGLYFTIWYGVYERSTRRLSYGTGGHPPAVLAGPAGDVPAEPEMLQTVGTPIGVLPDVPYQADARTIAPGSRLFVFSDGACEIELAPGGSMWEFEDFARHLAQPSAPGENDLNRLVNFARNLHGRPDFEDDFSIMRLTFD